MADQEVPEPDALEQATPVEVPDSAGATLAEDPEAPEADKLEQAQPAPLDDDDAWR
jgi:hypothetical protein